MIKNEMATKEDNAGRIEDDAVVPGQSNCYRLDDGVGVAGGVETGRYRPLKDTRIVVRDQKVGQDAQGQNEQPGREGRDC